MRGFPLLFLAVLASCGVPSVGDRCTSGTAACDSSSAMLWCQSGTFVRVGCPGPKGCDLLPSNQIFCDFRGSKEAEGCPVGLVGFNGAAIGVCGSSTSFLSCGQSSGVWEARRCSSCTTDGTSLTTLCTP
jgi:hypothetical protein